MNFKRRRLWLGILLISCLFWTLPNNPHISLAADIMMPTEIINYDLSDELVNQYYTGVEGKSGDNLLEALSTIIGGHREYDYESDNHRKIYKIIDRNWTLSPADEIDLNNYDYDNDNPFIRKLYADYNDDEATADRFKNVGASRVSFDKEHIWPQSLGDFGRTGGAGSDFHSLLPSDVKGNQQAHSNYNYAIPTRDFTTCLNDYGTLVGENGKIEDYDHKVFAPLIDYRGDVARAMFYMTARYYTYEDALHPKLTLVNGSPSPVTASETQPGLAGDLETLLLWHEADPVDQYELHRNNLIYHNYQLNRNPFIDHPEWAKMIYDPSYEGPGASLAEGTSTAAGLPPPPHRLTKIKISTDKTFTFLSRLSATDFDVQAFYLDGTDEMVEEFVIEIIAQDGLMLTKSGEVEIKISFTDPVFKITKSATMTINVEVALWQYAVLAAIALVFIVILIASPKARKKAKRQVKRKAKGKSQTKKKR
ncbi:MAG: endonuclease I family protein [Bacilli bacterium]